MAAEDGILLLDMLHYLTHSSGFKYISPEQSGRRFADDISKMHFCE